MLRGYCFPYEKIHHTEGSNGTAPISLNSTTRVHTVYLQNWTTRQKEIIKSHLQELPAVGIKLAVVSKGNYKQQRKYIFFNSKIFKFFSPNWADEVKGCRSHDKNVAWTRNGPGMVPARQDEDVCVLDTVGNGQCSLTSELQHVRFLLKKKPANSTPRVESRRWFGTLLYRKQRQDTSYGAKYLTCIFFWSPYPSTTCYETHSLKHNR